MAEILKASGCGVIDGAIRSPVPKHRHRVPILLCGPRVAEATAALAGLGFNVEDGGETLGAASATKMLRSIMIKGVEALFLECVAAASHFGATERVLNSLQPSLPGLDWRSEEHTSELQSLMRTSYAVLCLKKKKHNTLS